MGMINQIRGLAEKETKYEVHAKMLIALSELGELHEKETRETDPNNRTKYYSHQAKISDTLVIQGDMGQGNNFRDYLQVTVYEGKELVPIALFLMDSDALDMDGGNRVIEREMKERTLYKKMNDQLTANESVQNKYERIKDKPLETNDYTDKMRVKEVEAKQEIVKNNEKQLGIERKEKALESIKQVVGKAPKERDNSLEL
jgi:hypothetical protein